MTARKAGALLLLLMGALLFQGWGFSVHRQVNRAAVHALPVPLRDWFEREVDWLAEHAVDADKRKHRVEREGGTHILLQVGQLFYGRGESAGQRVANRERGIVDGDKMPRPWWRAQRGRQWRAQRERRRESEKSERHQC